VLRDGFRALRADVIGFQGVRRDAGHDTAAEILGDEYEIVDAPVGGVWASDHYGLVADLEPA
jgi:hypothetical protein